MLSRITELIDGPALRSLLLRRAAANGLDREELDLATRQVGSLSQLPRLLDSVARELENRAGYWAELGLQLRARDHYLNAALWAYYAQLMLGAAPEKQATIHARCVESYRLAAPYFDHPGEAIEIPYPAGQVQAYLRFPYIEDVRPADRSLMDRRPEADSDSAPAAYPGSPLPCVIMLNSFASSKEELHYAENAFLNLGLATLSFDYPTIGNTGENRLWLLNQEILGNALYLHLATHPGIDEERVALFGLGLGGALAIQLSMLFPDRYKAVAALSAPYELATRAERRLIGARTPLWEIELGPRELVAELAGELSLYQRLDWLATPLLVAGGGRDPYVRPEETRRIYEESRSQDKKLLFCPQASHGLYEMMPSLRHEMAQWINERL